MPQNKLTKEEVDQLSKELCWYDGGGEKCTMECETCKAGHFKKWKWIVKIIIPKWEKMKNASKN